MKNEKLRNINMQCNSNRGWEKESNIRSIEINSALFVGVFFQQKELS